MDFRSIAMRVASGTTAARKKSKKSKKSRKTKKTRTKKTKPRTSKPVKPVEPDPPEETEDEEESTDSILKPKTEYSCQLQISIIADFEGEVDQGKLKRKLKTESINAVKAGVATTAREYRLEATQITVQPISIECAVNSIE